MIKNQIHIFKFLVAEKPESFHANKLDFRQRSSNEENMEIDTFVKRLIAPKQEEISFEKFTKDHLIKQQKVQTSDQRKSLELKKVRKVILLNSRNFYYF